MMEMRGKLLKKMKPMETVFRGHSWNSLLDALPLNKGNPFRSKPQLILTNELQSSNQEQGVEDEEQEIGDKENLCPIKRECYRKKNFESATPNDSDFLAFQIAAEEQPAVKPLQNPPLKRRGRVDPLFLFEKRCPLNGSDSVVLYTTSLRGIRKTFEDCSNIRFLLDSFRFEYFERDVSMHAEFKHELRKLIGGRIILPTLFIKGRMIGGAEEVLKLHENGRFKELFEGIALNLASGPCEECCGFRFAICFVCHGSRKIRADDGVLFHCRICNENGLILCSLCC